MERLITDHFGARRVRQCSIVSDSGGPTSVAVQSLHWEHGVLLVLNGGIAGGPLTHFALLPWWFSDGPGVLPVAAPHDPRHAGLGAHIYASRESLDVLVLFPCELRRSSLRWYDAFPLLLGRHPFRSAFAIVANGNGRSLNPGTHPAMGNAAFEPLVGVHISTREVRPSALRALGPSSRQEALDLVDVELQLCNPSELDVLFLLHFVELRSQIGDQSAQCRLATRCGVGVVGPRQKPVGLGWKQHRGLRCGTIRQIP